MKPFRSINVSAALLLGLSLASCSSSNTKPEDELPVVEEGSSASAEAGTDSAPSGVAAADSALASEPTGDGSTDVAATSADNPAPTDTASNTPTAIPAPDSFGTPATTVATTTTTEPEPKADKPRKRKPARTSAPKPKADVAVTDSMPSAPMTESAPAMDSTPSPANGGMDMATNTTPPADAQPAAAVPPSAPEMPQAAMEQLQTAPVAPQADQAGAAIGAEGEEETPWYGSVKVMALLAAGGLGLVGGLAMLRKRSD
jgi:hypothetical protein